MLHGFIAIHVKLSIIIESTCRIGFILACDLKVNVAKLDYDGVMEITEEVDLSYLYLLY